MAGTLKHKRSAAINFEAAAQDRALEWAWCMDTGDVGFEAVMSANVMAGASTVAGRKHGLSRASREQIAMTAMNKAEVMMDRPDSCLQLGAIAIP